MWAKLRFTKAINSIEAQRNSRIRISNYSPADIVIKCKSLATRRHRINHPVVVAVVVVVVVVVVVELLRSGGKNSALVASMQNRTVNFPEGRPIANLLSFSLFSVNRLSDRPSLYIRCPVTALLILMDHLRRR